MARGEGPRAAGGGVVWIMGGESGGVRRVNGKRRT